MVVLPAGTPWETVWKRAFNMRCESWELLIGNLCVSKYGTIPEKYDKVLVARAMIDEGGGFVEHLGEALIRADIDNTTRIKFAFPHYWDRYGSMGLERHNRKVAGYF